MLLHDALAEKEAKSHSREAAVVDIRGAMEPLEDLREVAGGDADALIGHIDEGFTVPLGDVHADLAPIGAVLDGVLDQVLDHLTDPARIVGADHRRVRRHADPAALVAVAASDLARELDQIDRLALPDELALLEPRRIEELENERRQPPGLPHDPA